MYFVLFGPRRLHDAIQSRNTEVSDRRRSTLHAIQSRSRMILHVLRGVGLLLHLLHTLFFESTEYRAGAFDYSFRLY